MVDTLVDVYQNDLKTDGVVGVLASGLAGEQQVPSEDRMTATAAKFAALLSAESKDQLEAHSPYGRGGIYIVCQ